MADDPREAAYLTLDEAWRYVKATSRRAFQEEVRRGIWPKPVCNSRPPRWSRAALDRAGDPGGGIDDGQEAAALKAVQRRGPALHH